MVWLATPAVTQIPVVLDFLLNLHTIFHVLFNLNVFFIIIKRPFDLARRNYMNITLILRLVPVPSTRGTQKDPALKPSSKLRVP